MSTWPINLYPQDLGTYPWRRRAAPPSDVIEYKTNTNNISIRYAYQSKIGGKIVINESLDDLGSLRNNITFNKFTVELDNRECKNLYGDHDPLIMQCTKDIPTIPLIRGPALPVGGAFSLGQNIVVGLYKKENLSPTRECVLGWRPQGRGIDYIDLEFSGFPTSENQNTPEKSQLASLIGYYLNGQYSNESGKKGLFNGTEIMNAMGPNGALNWRWDANFRLESEEITSPAPGGLGLDLLGGLGGVLTTISVQFAPVGEGILDPGNANISVTMYTDNYLYNAGGNLSNILIGYSWIIPIENACTFINGAKSTNSSVLIGTGTAFMGPPQLSVTVGGRTTSENIYNDNI